MDLKRLDKIPLNCVAASSAFVPVLDIAANAAPMQLEDVNTHENPPGISGALIEGRFIYDAFVLVPKRSSAYQHKIA